MATALTILLTVLSAGILAGRIYEITALTDPQTGFFIYKGVVFSPYILVMFAVVTVCCAVVIFGENKGEKVFFSHSSKIIAAAAGLMFVLYGIMSLKTGITAVTSIAGGAAFIIMGATALKARFSVKDTVVTALFVVFIAGLCLDAIIFNVSTIYNIDFTKNAFSYIAASLLILMVLKNAFYPSRRSGTLLYIIGILAFVLCGVMHIADIVCMAVTDSIELPGLFFHAAFAFIGFFGLDNAISVMPPKNKQPAAVQTAENREDKVGTQQPAEAAAVTAAENNAETGYSRYTAFADSLYSESTEEKAVEKRPVKEKTKKFYRPESTHGGEKSKVTKTVYRKPK